MAVHHNVVRLFVIRNVNADLPACILIATFSHTYSHTISPTFVSSMQNNRVVRLLACLSPAEQKEFKRYIGNPFFNRSPLKTKAAHEILKALARAEAPPTRAHLFLKLFPEQRARLRDLPPEKHREFIGRKLDPLLSQLKSHVEDYLLWKASQKTGPARDYALVRELSERGAEALFFSYSEKAEARLDKTAQTHTDYHFYKYKLIVDRYDYPGRDRADNACFALEHGLSHLDRYFVAEKLNKAYVIKGRNLLYNVQSKIALMGDALDYACRMDPAEALQMKSYYFLYRNLQRGSFDPEEYAAFKHMVLAHIDAYPEADRHGLFKTLSDYLTWADLMQHVDLKAELYALMRLGLDKGYLLQNNRLNYTTVYNFIHVAAIVRKYEEAERWLRENQSKIPESTRANTVHAALAFIYFEAGKFREALRQLNLKTRPVNVIDKFKEKVLRIKCYYELEELEMVEATLESTRKQLERTEGLGTVYAANIGAFLRHVRHLYRLKLTRTYDKAFVADLKGKRRAGSQKWMLEKAQEIRN